MLIDKREELRNASEPEDIERRPRIRGRTGLSDASIYRLMKAGKFPKPVVIGIRAVGWRKSDIDDWLKSLEPKSAEVSR